MGSEDLWLICSRRRSHRPRVGRRGSGRWRDAEPRRACRSWPRRAGTSSPKAATPARPLVRDRRALCASAQGLQRARPPLSGGWRERRRRPVQALHGERVSPLVGRDHEIGLLLDRFARLRRGRPGRAVGGRGRHPRQDDQIQLQVFDTGIAIAANRSPSTLDRIHSVRDQSPEAHGTGLVLATVKCAIERHLGAACVRSELGMGCTFWPSRRRRAAGGCRAAIGSIGFRHWRLLRQAPTVAPEAPKGHR